MNQEQQSNLHELRNQLKLYKELKRSGGYELFYQNLMSQYQAKMQELTSPDLTPDERQYGAGQANVAAWATTLLDANIATTKNQIQLLELHEANSDE